MASPVTGSSPVATAALTNPPSTTAVVSPVARNRPSGSGAFFATRRKPRASTHTKASRTSPAPTIPYSSAMMAKMKSL